MSGGSGFGKPIINLMTSVLPKTISYMANLNERAELHKTIWQIANDLRGSVDGWDFKNWMAGISRTMCLDSCSIVLFLKT